MSVDDFDLRPADYQPTAPEKHDYGIGVVGCGGIMRGAHLPAYRNFGYRVVGCADLEREAVRHVRERFDIPFGVTNPLELAEREDVEIIDLAVPASVRRQAMEQLAPVGKPILSQKPFAMSYGDALAMVELCERYSVTLMVNQQARWAPAHRAIKRVIDSGILGHVYSVTHFHRSFQDVEGSWFVDLENFNIIDHGIHYLDLTRFFTGRTPVRVKATATMIPGQFAVTPMAHTILMEYDPDAMLMAESHFNNIVPTRSMHCYEWHVDGTDGSLRATHNELTIGLKDHPHAQKAYRIQGSWFPDAFGGSMGEMMTALTEERAPQTSGHDNLNSIKVAYAAVESANTGRAVALSEIG